MLAVEHDVLGCIQAFECHVAGSRGKVQKLDFQRSEVLRNGGLPGRRTFDQPLSDTYLTRLNGAGFCNFLDQCGNARFRCGDGNMPIGEDGNPAGSAFAAREQEAKGRFDLVGHARGDRIYLEYQRFVGTGGFRIIRKRVAGCEYQNSANQRCSADHDMAPVFVGLPVYTPKSKESSFGFSYQGTQTIVTILQSWTSARFEESGRIRTGSPAEGLATRRTEAGDPGRIRHRGRNLRICRTPVAAERPLLQKNRERLMVFPETGNRKPFSIPCSSSLRGWSSPALR